MSRINPGDLYRTIGLNPDRYIQFIGQDIVDMNSDVIVIYNSEFNPKLSKPRLLDISFYTHTSIEAGVNQGLWEKIDTLKLEMPLLKLDFKQYFGGDDADILEEFDRVHMPHEPTRIPYPKWSIWTLGDQDWRYISADEGEKNNAEDGSILPPQDVILRIQQ